jgi:hypothetical protein
MGRSSRLVPIAGAAPTLHDRRAPSLSEIGGMIGDGGPRVDLLSKADRDRHRDRCCFADPPFFPLAPDVARSCRDPARRCGGRLFRLRRHKRQQYPTADRVHRLIPVCDRGAARLGGQPLVHPCGVPGRMVYGISPITTAPICALSPFRNGTFPGASSSTALSGSGLLSFGVGTACSRAEPIPRGRECPCASVS